MTAKPQRATDSKAVTALPSPEKKQLWAQILETLEDSKKGLDALKKQDQERQQYLARWVDFYAEADGMDETRFRVDPELHAAFLELREAIAENRRLRPLFEVRRCRGRTGKTKLGRPPLWRGYDGLFFVTAVNTVRGLKSWSTVRAIRYVKEHIRGLEKLRGLSDAALQVRYTEASKYWALFLNPKECWAVIEQQDASLSRIAGAGAHRLVTGMALQPS
jgi:hypothetical protein